MKERLRKLSARLDEKGLTSEAGILIRMADDATYTCDPKLKSEYERLQYVESTGKKIAALLKTHAGTTYSDPAQANQMLRNLTAELEDLQGYVKMLDAAFEKDWSYMKDWEHSLLPDED